MLLKYNQYQKRSRLLNGPQRSTGGMKILNGKGKGYRKGVKCAATKRLNTRTIVSKKEDISPLNVDPCDNSNDSGLGFDHLDYSSSQSVYVEQEYCWGSEDVAKKRRYDFKHESDNANDNFTFLPKVAHRPSDIPLCRGKGGVVSRSMGKKVPMAGNGSQGLSRNGKVHLEILSQPEMQHRARYQTEGSRGAVKDRTGNSFPIVKLSGYKKAATLEVYIGTDQGRVAPHMFYQACRVSGKNSTPCIEKKVDGTVLIEIEMDPSKDMTVTCDCVGILKERNVDVEHRFPEESSGRSKKKSTRCRMVFRTNITNDDGTVETLQVTSQPIICTQPPGIPEICKKSLTSCPASGGLELFILGKNFLKDTQVLFSQGEPGTDLFWECLVQPDKEFLQQSHLVCSVPPYRDEGIRDIVAVRLIVTSSGRSSEPHTFVYTPNNALPMDPSTASRASAQNLVPNPVFPGQSAIVSVPWHLPISPAPSFIQEDSPKSEEKAESEMMPPPATVPPMRRSEVKREAESPPNPEFAAAIRELVSSADSELTLQNLLSRIDTPPEQPPQLSLPPQQPPTVIIQPKLEGLLGERNNSLMPNPELMYTAGDSVGANTAALLESAEQDFVSAAAVAVGQAPGGMVQTPGGMAQTAGGMGHSAGVMVQTSAGIVQTGRGMVQTSGGMVQAPGGMIQTSAGIVQAAGGIVQTSGAIVQAAGGMVQTSGGIVQTAGGMVQTSGGMVQTSGGIVQTAGGMVQTSGGIVQTAGGMVQTSGGIVQTSGGMVQTSGGIVQTAGGMVQTSGGIVQTAGGMVQTSGGIVQTAGGMVQTSGGIVQTAGGMVYSPENLPAPSISPLSPPALPPTQTALTLNVFPAFQEATLPPFPAEKETKPVLLRELPPNKDLIPQKKCEDGIALPGDITQMSEHDLLSYINPSCFDQSNQSTFSSFFM